MPFKAALRIMSDDPEVMALQAVVRGVSHFEAKAFTPLHLAVLSSVELSKKALHVPQPTMEQIGAIMGIEPKHIEAEVENLADHRYLTRQIEQCGPASDAIRYSLGPTGAVALKKMLARQPKKKKDVSVANENAVMP